MVRAIRTRRPRAGRSKPAGTPEGVAPRQGDRATLVIAKLDRLSRNAAFLLTLRDSGVKFAAVDLPEANDLTVGIMALVAQAGARGDLEADQGGAGGGHGAAACGWATPTARRRSGGLARAVRRSGRPLRATPTGMRRTSRRWSRTSARGGATSLRAIAGELNARGMLTRRGGRWHVSTVMNLLDRLGEQRCRNPG